MKLYYHNYGGCTGALTEAAAIRLAYMLTDEVIVNPMVWYLMGLCEEYMQVPQQEKEKLIRSSLKDEPDMVTGYERCLQYQKQLRSIRHKNGREILALRKLEKIMEEFYLLHANSIIRRLSVLGYDQFSSLLGKDGLAFYNTSDNHPEGNHKECTPLSLLMQRFTDEPEHQDPAIMFFLPEEVFSAAFKEETFYTANDPEAAQPANAWFEKVGDLPDINGLTGAEMAEVRSRLRAPCQAFREAGTA